MAIEDSPPPRDGAVPNLSTERPGQHGRVQVRERNGVWEVRDDGVFRGDYHKQEHALAAAELLKLSPR